MRLINREEVGRRWREFELRQRPRTRAAERRDEPELVNLRPALYLTGPLRIPFRGRMWCAHVAFDDGLRIVDIAQRIERAREAGDVDAMVEAVHEAKRIASRLLRRYPERWWHWLGRVAGLRLSPVRDWTEQEVGELLGFFLMCRTSTRVGVQSAKKVARTGSTSSTGSRTSPVSFRVGSTAAASR